MLAKEIHSLSKRLIDTGKQVTIETAATLPPKGIACSLASISPKLSNSTPGKDVSEAARQRHEAQRFQPDIIRDWMDHYDYQLKFVVCSGSDIAEIRELLYKLDRDIPPERVLLMPQGVDTEALSMIETEVIEICKKQGFRFCDRLHIRLFGNKRGR